MVTAIVWNTDRLFSQAKTVQNYLAKNVQKVLTVTSTSCGEDGDIAVTVTISYVYDDGDGLEYGSVDEFNSDTDNDVSASISTSFTPLEAEGSHNYHDSYHGSWSEETHEIY